MSRVLFTISVVFLVALVIVFKLATSPKATNSAVMVGRLETHRARLTEAEERDLEKLIPQTLSWIATWIQPTNCLVNEEIHKLDFVETYKKYERKEIEAGLEVHERSLVVSLDSLHTSLSFARLYDAGLSPAEFNLFCENSYKEYEAEVSRLQEMNRPRYEEMLKEQRVRDSKSAEVMDRIRKTHPHPTEDGVMGEEMRRYRMTQLTERGGSEIVDWSDEKKALYQRVLDVIRDQTKCAFERVEAVEATIPDFNLGDPAMYVLMRGPFYGGGNYIEWIDFDRNPSTGEYTARHMKSFGLPDEVQPLVPLIKRRQIKQLHLRCPA